MKGQEHQHQVRDFSHDPHAVKNVQVKHTKEPGPEQSRQISEQRLANAVGQIHRGLGGHHQENANCEFAESQREDSRQQQRHEGGAAWEEPCVRCPQRQCFGLDEILGFVPPDGLVGGESQVVDTHGRGEGHHEPEQSTCRLRRSLVLHPSLPVTSDTTIPGRAYRSVGPRYSTRQAPAGATYVRLCPPRRG